MFFFAHHLLTDRIARRVIAMSPFLDDLLTCPLKTNPNLERESKDSGVCKEAGNDEEAIHERTDYPQAEGNRS